MSVEINGVRLAYDDLGNGPAVMLIHGYPLCRRMWRPQVEALAAAGFRVIVPDLRGFGESTAGDEPGSMDRLADDLVALLDHLNIDRATIGGMSMGGYVLLNLLARHRRRLAGACFIVTRADADDETGRSKRNHLIAEAEQGRAATVVDVFTSLVFAEATMSSRPELVAEVRGWMSMNPPAGLILGLQAIRDRVDSSSLLPRLQLPTLVIGAADDRAIPPEKSKDIAAQLSGAKLSILAGGGHMINLEQPEAFNKALIDFLRTVPG